MKKHFILAAMAMTALFTACNNEDDNLKSENEGKEVTFVIGGVDSRTTTSTDFTTTFVTNDAIGISGTNLSTDMNNVKYNVTVTDNNVTIAADESASFTYTENTAIFNAYYPYAQDFSNSFAVQTDQATNGIASSDFLTATATGSNESTAVTLNFSHRMALVQVKLSGMSDISYVTLKNAKTTVSYTASTDGRTAPTVSTNDDTSSDITMYKVTDNSTYWAIIPAQELAAGALIQVTTSTGDTYTYKTSAATTIEENNIYKYSLSVASSGETYSLVSYNPITIAAWTNGATEIEGSLEKEKFTLTNLFPESSPTSGSYVTQISETPTWLYGTLQNVTINTTETVNSVDNTPVISFQTAASSTSLSWSNCGLAYFGGTKTTLSPSGTYTLNFWAKATTETDWDNSTSTPSLNIFIYDKITRASETSNNNMFYGISYDTTTNAGRINITPTNEWKEYTFTLDISKYAVSVTNSATNVNSYDKAYFSICFNTLVTSQSVNDAEVLATFYIANISLTEN